MSDFQFIENRVAKKWVILSPKRARRPDVAKGPEPVCPFCLGREKEEPEVFRISSEHSENSESQQFRPSDNQTVRQSGMSGSPSVQSFPKSDQDWLVRVVPNKFPFAPIHEVIIHSPDHHKNFDELPLSQIELILQTYRQRYLTHQGKGQVYIFHNRGEGGGESLPHPHTQLAVVPKEVKMETPRLDPASSSEPGQTTVATDHFYLFCPHSSQWPDEVWIAPKKRGRAFGEITDEEIADLAATLARVIQMLNLRHGHEFPYNFYIYQGGDWYLRLIPRVKSLGGFELGSGIFVNTQDPDETIAFFKKHFHAPDHEKIKTEHRAEYSRGV